MPRIIRILNRLVQEMIMGLFSSKLKIDSSSEHRDWELVSSIAQDALREQRRARRWGIFFKLLTFSYLTFIIVGVITESQQVIEGITPSEAHTAAVVVQGTIADGEEANANALISGLRRAFDNQAAAAVMMIINSPGGSPVQAGYVYDEVLRLKAKYPDKKVYAVIKDIGASGAYYIAAAADEIYADKASLVGSIGVTASSFGFVDLMGKLGVERRNFTSGEHKSFLDPFSPLKKEEKRFWESVLSNTHQQFIEVVREGRGQRLVETEDLFSGLIWNGEQALTLGLVDGLASPGTVAREIIGEENIEDYTLRFSPLEAFTRRFGTSVGAGIAKAVGISTESPVDLF
ncbi:MAG: protease-4 [Cellvibrionaceae bacterium]